VALGMCVGASTFSDAFSIDFVAGNFRHCDSNSCGTRCGRARRQKRPVRQPMAAPRLRDFSCRLADWFFQRVYFSYDGCDRQVALSSCVTSIEGLSTQTRYEPVDPVWDHTEEGCHEETPSAH